MDIDELVRRARPHAEPEWSRSEQGRQALTEVLSRPAGPARRGADHTGTRRSAVRWSFLGTGLVGAAAAAALVLPGALNTPGGDPRPPVAVSPGGPAVAPAPADPVPLARDVLLAAATRAEEAPQATGKYWHVRKELVFGPIRVGRGAGTYHLMQRQVQETWLARGAGGGNWSGLRDLGARPRAAADDQAWRAAGSPTTWNLGPSDTADRHDLVLSSRPEKGSLVKAAPGAPGSARSPLDYTVEAARRLPADEAGLRQVILRGIRADADFPAGSGSENIRLFGEMTRLLLDAPAPPKVRAAAFRVLAGIPGVRSLGEVRDADGRPGLGVEMSGQEKGVASTHQIIVDAATHQLLAETAISGRTGKGLPIKEQSTLVYAAQWSDVDPRVPALPGR